jgi:hypothetical protein
MVKSIVVVVAIVVVVVVDNVNVVSVLKELLMQSQLQQ